MRVFVTGATGFVGSAVVRELIDAGHEVVGLARSDKGATALAAAGAEVRRGDIDDLAGLRAAAAAADGVAHLAFKHDDFTDLAGAGAADLRAVEALGEALEGSGKPLVVTSGLGFKPGTVGTETDPAAPGSHRGPSEAATLALADRGVRSVVLRLPIVHGPDDPGFVPRLIDIAREKGVSAVVEGGTNHWAAVHLHDAARLYRLALESAAPGTRVHAVDDEGIPLRTIAATIARHLNLPLTEIPRPEALTHFGWLGPMAGLDVRASSALTRERLGWKPEQAGLIADLEEGHYFAEGRRSKF
ncbi:SDR family oxidoreductase [Streptomyces sp. NPDC046909]|uniref:SDR family oxidoreductase n=1 Tax=Streptomyces sp. NPDC046909 TaxID=3155617 RepID=UPI0033D18367